MIRLSIAALALSTTALAAQELGSPVFSSQSQGAALGFTLRGGVSSAPEYFGSDTDEGSATLSGSLNYLRLGGFTFGDPDFNARRSGFSVGGSFRYIGDREAADSPELAGLDDIDASLELGAGLRYTAPNWQVFGNVRYGVIGHESLVGELGADIVARPTDRLTLSAGPRAFFGSDDYASTYFGVTAAEAGRSTFTQFDADGGLLSTGVEFGASYQINDLWGVDASVTYDRLRNDAADSPISARDESFGASIGVTRRFTLGF